MKSENQPNFRSAHLVMCKKPKREGDSQIQNAQDHLFVNPCCAKSKQIKPSMIPILKCEKLLSKNILMRQKKYVPGTKVFGEKRVNKSKIECKLRSQEKLNGESKVEYKKEISVKEEDCKKEFGVPKKTSSDFLLVKGTNLKIVTSEVRLSKNVDMWAKSLIESASFIENLKIKLCKDSNECELERLEAKVGIKQIKSVTIIKSRNIVEEATKGFEHQKMIRTELESILDKGMSKSEDAESVGNAKEGSPQVVSATGDSMKENNAEFCPVVSNDDEGERDTEENGDEKCFEIPENIQGMKSKKGKNESGQNEMWVKEMEKKKKTISSLNRKVFELEGICDEQSSRCNQLKAKLLEFQDKIEWSEILWKQMAILKNDIKLLQKNNKQLESYKASLEYKVGRLKEDLERIMSMNRLLNRNKSEMNVEESVEPGGVDLKKNIEEFSRGLGSSGVSEERVFQEKGNAIKTLRLMLKSMKEQENEARKQMSSFQSKIAELENK